MALKQIPFQREFTNHFNQELPSCYYIMVLGMFTPSGELCEKSMWPESDEVA
jgi:hypothetical protein